MTVEPPTDEDLVEFVRQSNRIEGEPTYEDHPLFVSHLNAARHAVEAAIGRGGQLDPVGIHTTLMAPEPEKQPGRYRTVPVYVGGYEKLDPGKVFPEMAALCGVADNVLRLSRTGVLHGSRTAVTWNLHHWFESVHPFIDGNGRTGRTWLNYLRLRMGLPWLTVRYGERLMYYNSIRTWELEHPLGQSHS